MSALSVLLIEDNPDDAELLIRELNRAGFDFQWQRIETEAEYLDRLQGSIDLILADYSLPQFSALRALYLLQELELDIPMIVVTGTVTEAIVVECMKQGASDYLLKDRLTRLSIAVNHALDEKRLRDAKRQADEALRRHAAELEHRVAERTDELQRAKDYVEAILNHASDAIILAGGNGNIQHINPAFERLFGYQADEVLGKSLLMVAHPDYHHLLEDELRTARQENKPRRIEMNVQRSDGTVLTADVALAPTGAEHEYGGIVCNIWDISERKRVEENLRQALEREKELSDLKSRFSSMVSHEFRTPLAVIQSSTDLLRTYREQMSVEKQISQLEKIQLQVKRLTELLNDILTLGKAQTVGLDFNPEYIDVYDFSLEIIGEMRATAITHSFQFEAQDESYNAYVDAKLLRQALTNLLSNAIKYSPVNSTIYFRMRCEEQRIVIEIQDEGEGIAPEDQEHLFEVFYRAKNVLSIQGTGLGLPIVKQAIEAHGGAVTCQSELGHGSTFTLYVPLTPTNLAVKE